MTLVYINCFSIGFLSLPRIQSSIQCSAEKLMLIVSVFSAYADNCRSLTYLN